MELRTKVLVGFAVTSLFCCGGIVLVGLHFFDFPFASREADSAAAAYRGAGMPWEAKDLAPDPPVIDAENAAPLLEKATKDKDLKAFERERDKIAATLDAGHANDAAKDLEPYAKLLDIAMSASKKPRLDFHRDWDFGTELQFPEDDAARSLARLTCLRAQIRAAQHDAARSNQDLAAAFRLADVIGQEPVMISMLVRISMKAIASDAAVRCAALDASDPKALEALAATVSRFQTIPSFGFALRGDAYMRLATLRNLELLVDNEHDSDSGGAPPPPINPADLKRTGIPEGMFLRGFAARFFERWTKVKAAIDKHPDDPRRIGEAINAASANQAGLSNILVSATNPSYGQAGDAVVECQAKQRVTLALVQALLIKARTGRLPTRIEEIPGQWIDPFDDKPLRVKTAGNSIRIYSVSRNLRDDGGVDRRELKGPDKKDFDTVAAYPPVKRSADR